MRDRLASDNSEEIKLKLKQNDNVFNLKKAP